MTETIKKSLGGIEKKPFDLQMVCDDLVQNGYGYYCDILPVPLMNGLYDTLKTLKAHNMLLPASIGRGNNKMFAPQIRKDKTLWINGDTPHEKEFLHFLEKLRQYFNQILFLNLSSVESHYAMYNTGDFYARHVDSFKDSNSRIISLVIYLNKNWYADDGGYLELYQTLESYIPFERIMPEYNHGVFFLSREIPHQVTICHKNRYSIACWFRCNPIRSL
jgi:SM-20-related protein